MALITSQPRSAFSIDGSNPSSSGSSGRGMELADIMARRAEKAEVGYLPGLGCLERYSSIHIQQQLAVDIKGRCGSGNTYHIKSPLGERLLYAVEGDNCCCRWFCGPQRSFNITLYDNQDDPVLILERSACRCDWWCCADCFCCQNKLIAKDINGELLASVRERFHLCNLKMEASNPDGERWNKIQGPCCVCRCCKDINFDILNKNGENEDGFIFKEWEGFREWVNMDHENFIIQWTVTLFSDIVYNIVVVPEYSSVKQKVSLLAAGFLVHFMYFEMS